MSWWTRFSNIFLYQEQLKSYSTLLYFNETRKNPFINLYVSWSPIGTNIQHTYLQSNPPPVLSQPNMYSNPTPTYPHNNNNQKQHPNDNPYWFPNSNPNWTHPNLYSNPTLTPPLAGPTPPQTYTFNSPNPNLNLTPLQPFPAPNHNLTQN